MKEQVIVTMPVHASEEAIWNIVKDPSGWETWFALIQHSSVDGAKRVCYTPQGELKETIEVIDERQKIFQYRIYEQRMLPIQDIVGTIQVTTSDVGETTVRWKAEFEALDSANVDEVKQTMRQLYRQAIEGLNKKASNTTV